MKKTLLTLLAALTAIPAFAQFTPRHIYNENADSKAEIRDALATAAREHKRVILDFGGNWCGDCQVLDIYFHRAPNDQLLNANYVLVDIDIGRMDKNVDVAEKYDIPLRRGVPALAVIDAHGRLLYSQKDGEFEKMRSMDPGSVTRFLEQWKPADSKGGQ
ncbi:MAG TPA: thioredoxin family protein [Acidobacteriaceae bacterium]|jgi:thiol:disulfide interchange protein|nr:thioredoxin family protein [Acidobacteriaceae bacterium]